MHTATSATERVLSYLLEQQAAVTRPMIAAACEVSRPTVFTAIERLVELGLVEDIGQMSGRPGRSATLFQMSPTAGASLGRRSTEAATGQQRGESGGTSGGEEPPTRET